MHRLQIIAWLWISAACIARADWRDDAGLPALQAELGAATPNGSRIPVLQSEANAMALPGIAYLPLATGGSDPFLGTGIFAGKTFTPYSGASSASSHASSVASAFFGNGTSLSPGVSEIHSYLADDFADLLYLDGVQLPSVFPGSVQNHSWVASFGNTAVDVEFLRRLDYMIQRDSVVCITPMNNGSTMAVLLANAYHSISVGLRSGAHPQTGTNTDGSGRMKPDLVVNQGLTSYAAPSVGSAAAMLLDAIRPDYPAADDPRVVKAILLAGASKTNIPAWRRTQTFKPYDAVWGAGELNVLNAYHILAANEQAASNSIEVGRSGWHKHTTSVTQPRRYFFSIPAERWGNEFSAALTWHRSIPTSFGTSPLSDLNLKLYAASGLVVQGAALDQSISTLDNVEHICFRNLPAGQYALEVSAAASNVVYGLAWETRVGAGPTLKVRLESGGQTFLDLETLDPYVSYTIESSQTMASADWSAVVTVRTADSTASTTASWQDLTGQGTLPRFYRLRWTSPR